MSAIGNGDMHAVAVMGLAGACRPNLNRRDGSPIG
jgi:hypothetical protein